jgi:hypothetical protein
VRELNPIVDEVRAFRDAIAKEYDYDIAKIAEAVRTREGKSGRTFVRLSPRKPLPTKKAGSRTAAEQRPQATELP